MSGFMRKAALVVGAVALIASTAGLAAPAVAATATTAATAGGVAGISAATLTAIGTYGGLAAGVLTAISTATAPGLSSQGSQTSFQTNPQSGLPYAMGRTRMSGLRMYANTNTRPGYTKFNDLLWFGALLSIGGAIGGIEKFTADNEIVTFDATGNAIGNYHDYQAQKIHLGGPQASALALTLGGGSAPGWTAAHRLSGITHAMWCLRYNKQGEMYGAGAPEPAWIGKWVKVYDPRLDSTYPGGSGSCRPLVESTYVWSDNPGLHALTWALGRWENGKRTCGIGAPIANIRVAEFVECANVCEANGWKVGGVEWTTDSKWDTLKRILQAGGARPTQTGAMIGCLVSTPRTAIATIESRHLLDSLSIAATKSRRDRFNSVIPRYVDENSDWSVISGTVVSVPEYVSADGGGRTKEIDYPLVQVFSGQIAMQPGQLAAYDIVNSREAGPINFTTGPEWIGLKTGDVVLLNVPEEGLINQPVLITRRAPDPSTGKVAFSAQTETYSKHAYALGQSTTPPAPFSLTAPDLKPPAPREANWAAVGTVTGEGLPAIIVTGSPEMPSADAVVIDYRLSGDDEWTRAVIVSANDFVRHAISPLASATPYDVRVGYRVGEIDGDFVILYAVTGEGKLSGIEDGATKGAPPGTPISTVTSDDVLAALMAVASVTDPNEIVAGALALIDRTQNHALALFDAQLLGEERKARWDRLTHLDGVEITTSVRQEITRAIDAEAGIIAVVNAYEVAATDGISAAMAALSEEQNIRAAADTAQTAQTELAISLVQTRIDDEVVDLQAAILNVETTSANAISAETAQRETAMSAYQTHVDGQIALVEASIDESSATAASALASETATRELQLSTYQGQVADQFADVTAAFNGSITTLASNLSAETTTREQQFSQVETRIDNEISTVMSALASEVSTLAAADQAQVNQHEALAASMESGFDSVAAVQDIDRAARVTGDEAEATAREALAATISGDIADVSAAVESAVTALAAEDAALASLLSGVQTTVDDHTASVAMLLESVDGLNARWGVRIVRDGPGGTPAVSGVMLNDDGEESDFTVLADKFRVFSNGTGDRYEFGDGRQIIVGGSVMTVTGRPFGSSDQFMEWTGPIVADLSECTEANAIKYVDVDGNARFMGGLSSGILKNEATSTVVSATAFVTVGPFASEGSTVNINISARYHRDYQADTGTGGISGSGSGVITVEHSADGETWTGIGTMGVAESVRDVVVDGEPGVPDIVTWEMAGAATLIWNPGPLSGLFIRARWTSRIFPAFNGTPLFGTNERQSVTIIAVETP